MDTPPSVLDALEAVLTPETIQEISTQLGTDTSTTTNAISMAVPILLGGLSTNAADADGAAALDATLSAHDTNGAAILGSIVGTRRGPVEDGISRATGLTAQQVSRLLTTVAPLILGVLAKMKSEENVGADELPAVLGQASLDLTRQSAAIGDLSRILGSKSDDDIADEISRIGSSVVGGMLGR